MDKPLPPGQQWIKQLQDQGLSDEDIAAMKQKRVEDAIKGGYSQDDVDKYFGEQPSKMPDTIGKIAQDNTKEAGFDSSKLQPADPNSWSDLFSAGWGNSVLSLEYQGAPTKSLPPPEQMGFFGSFMASAGQFAGDFPASFSGGFLTGLATKSPVASAYAFNAVPEAIRQGYLAHYETGAPVTIPEIIRRVNNAGLVGIAGGKAGELAGNALEPIAAPIVKKAGEAVAMATASTAAASGLEGHLPTAEEFAAGALFAVAFPIAGRGAEILYSNANPRGRIDLTTVGAQLKSRMETIWAKTGVPPADAAKAAAADPYLRQTVMGADADGVVVTDPWKSKGLPDAPSKFAETPEKKLAAEEEAAAVKDKVTKDVEGINKAAAAEDPEHKPIPLTGPVQPVAPGRPEPRGPLDRNHLRRLNREAPVLHREMSVDRFMDAHNGDTGFTQRLHFSDDPKHARYNDSDAGVLIQMDARDHDGRVNTTRSGPEGYSNRAADWHVDTNNTKMLNSIQKVTVSEEAWNALSPDRQRVLARYLAAQEARGAIVEAPGYKTTPTPLKAVGDVPDSGIPHVEKVSPDQLSAIAGEPVDPKLAKQFVNEDGSTDLEAALIAHKDGPEAAKAYRATGRDFSKLPVPTQRYLTVKGSDLADSGALVPLAGKGAGGGKPPIVPPGGGGGTAGAAPDPRFTRSPEIMAEVVNEGVAPRSYRNRWKEMWRVAKAGSWWRELALATRFDKVLGVTKDELQIGLEDFLRLANASSGRTKARLEYGGIKMEADQVGNPYYDVNKRVRPFKAIIDDAGKLAQGGVDRFRSYLQARDTVSRNQLGLKTTTDINDALETIRANETAPDAAVIKKLGKDWNDMIHDTLLGLKHSGVLNDEQITALEVDHPNWFPQKVSKEKLNDQRSTFSSSGATKNSVFKNAKGHDYMLEDQFLETIHSIDRREKLSSINIARRFAVETLKKHFGGESTERGLTIPPKKSTALVPKNGGWKKGEIETDALGTKFVDNETVSDPKFFEMNDNVIVYYENGRKMEYKVPEFPAELGMDRKAFMEMIMSPSLVQQDLAKGLLNLVARGQRYMIAATPKFVIRVMFQDSFQSAILSKYGGIPLVNSFRGGIRLLDHLVNKENEGPLGRAWTRYEMNGGFNMGLVEMDSNKSLEFFNRLINTGHYGRLANGRAHYFEVAKEFLRAADAINRTALFTKAEKELGTIKGAMESRVVHGDFAEKSAVGNGATMNLIAAMTPFFRSKMRGFVDASIRQFSKDATGVAMRGFGFVAVPTMMVVAYNYWFDSKFGDDLPENAKYSELDRGERDVSWHIPFFNTDGQVVRMRLPTPFENGAVITGLTHRFMDQWKGDDPTAFHGFLDAMMRKIVTSDVPMLGNPVLNWIVERKTGVDTYTGRPLMPARLEHLSAENQVLPWSTATAKGVSKMINSIAGGDTLSPVTVDQAIKDWGGDLGSSIINTLDRGTVAIPFWKGINENEPTGAGMENDPWLGSFFMRHPGMNARSIQDFYDAYTDYQKRKSDLKAAERSGDPDKFEAAMARAPMMKLDAPAKALGQIRTAIYAAQANKELSSSDKQQLVDSLADQMVDIARMQVTQWRMSLDDQAAN